VNRITKKTLGIDIKLSNVETQLMQQWQSTDPLYLLDKFTEINK
jgi:hypothetical protein